MELLLGNTRQGCEGSPAGVLPSLQTGRLPQLCVLDFNGLDDAQPVSCCLAWRACPGALIILRASAAPPPYHCDSIITDTPDISLKLSPDSSAAYLLFNRAQCESARRNLAYGTSIPSRAHSTPTMVLSCNVIKWTNAC
jgi:hypothetical protein